jgi:hypothetical protein
MQSSPHLFCIQAAHTDLDALEMMDVGYLLFEKDELTKENATKLWERAPLRAALIEAMIKGKICGTCDGTEFRLYCHRANVNPHFKGFHLLAGVVEPEPNDPWISDKLRAHASEIIGMRRVKLAKIAANEALGIPCDDAYSSFLTSQAEVELSPELLANIPVAITINVRTTDPDKLQRIARKAILASGTLSPYGRYIGILASAIPDEAALVLISEPFKGAPSFDDIKNAVQHRLPGALRKPRLDNVEISTTETADAITLAPVALQQIEGFDTRSPAWKAGFSDGQYSFDEREQRARRGREALHSQGFEAVAWYQPWHTHSENAWGIYFNASMLDDAVCAFLEDLNHVGIFGISEGLASQLLFGMVYEHEIFHARVEASTAVQELTATQSRFVRYQDKVYRPTLGTSACVEEALANWWAWSLMQAESALMTMSGILNSEQQEALCRVVNATLDLSPPGYSDWRMGHDRESWRQLATQLTSGKQTREFGLPIEALLKGPLLFEFKPEDVPVYFVGDGQVCQRILSSPASLNLPSRSELRQVLKKFFKYELMPGKGHGSHENWQHANGKKFPVPLRDPVSSKVFRSFLNHFNIDKAYYVQKVRPAI